jgi:hypothetical protein
MPLTIFIVVTVASVLVHLDVKSCFKLNSFNIRKLHIYLMVFVSTYIISNFVLDMLIKLFPKILENFSQFGAILSVDNLWLSILTIAFLPAVFEELLFRGVIFNAFHKKYGMYLAIIVSALLFGAYHMNWLQGINAFILGLSLAYIYLKSNSLIVPILFHFINNLISVLMDYYKINIEIPNSYNIYFIICSVGLLALSIYLSEKKE